MDKSEWPMAIVLLLLPGVILLAAFFAEAEGPASINAEALKVHTYDVGPDQKCHVLMSETQILKMTCGFVMEDE